MEFVPPLPLGTRDAGVYEALNAVVAAAQLYEPISLLNFLPASDKWQSMARNRWLNGLSTRHPLFLVTWRPLGPHENQYWVMKTPEAEVSFLHSCTSSCCPAGFPLGLRRSALTLSLLCSIVQEERASAASNLAVSAALQQCAAKASTYLARGLLLELRQKYASLAGDWPPALLRRLVQVITGDESAPVDSAEAAVNARVLPPPRTATCSGTCAP